LVLGACTASEPDRGRSSPAATPRSPDQPEIGELVDVRGPEIDVSSLQGRIAFSSATDDVYVIDAVCWPAVLH
jgi:hypothetical protein